MRVALADIPEQTLAPPPDIVSAKIDSFDGLLAPPDDKNAIFEVFRADTVPTETSTDNNETGGEEDNGALLF